MNKFISICYVFLIFIVSTLIVKPQIGSLLNESNAISEIHYSTGGGVLASSLRIRNLYSSQIFESPTGVIGEKIVIDSFDGSLNVILNKLGVRVVKVHNLNTYKLIEGVSALIPYKNSVDNDYNIELKYYPNKLIIGAPKIF